MNWDFFSKSTKTPFLSKQSDKLFKVTLHFKPVKYCLTYEMYQTTVRFPGLSPIVYWGRDDHSLNGNMSANKQIRSK